MLTYRTNQLLSKLKPSELDDLYQVLFADHIRKDTVVFASSNHISIDKNTADFVAEYLVEKKNYSNEKSYWKNIEDALSIRRECICDHIKSEEQ